MPQPSSNGKILKKGNYLTWPCVLAHARKMCEQGEITTEEFEAVKTAVGHYSQRVYCDDQLTAIDYTNLSHVEEHGLQMADVLELSETQSFADVVEVDLTMRAFHARSISTKELFDLPHLQHEPGKLGLRSLPRNTKVHIYCDASPEQLQSLSQDSYVRLRLPKCTRLYFALQFEDAIARCRTMMPFTEHHMQAVLSRQNKKYATVSALDQQEFAVVKANMDDESATFERNYTNQAFTPGDVAQAAMMPAATGKELARIARLQQRLNAPVT